MRTDYTKNRLCPIILGLLVLMIIGICTAEAAQPVRIAVIPFKMNAEKDLSFLKDGIFDMFAFRLSEEGKVTVINREETENAAAAFSGTLNQRKAGEIGSKLNADYVLFGSVTVFGQSVSISAKMVPVSGESPLFTFFDQTKDMDEVVPKISKFANDIRGKFSDKQTIASAPEPAPPQPSESSEPTRQSESPVPPEASEKVAPLNPAFIVTRDRKTSHEMWKSRDFDFIMNGMVLTDADQDGKTETVIATSDSVLIFRGANGRLDKVGEIPTRYKNLIGIDAGDINGNGYPEIFVTGLNPQRKGVRSFVLEWNGQAYAELVNNSPWYYRVVQLPGEGAVLLGQKNTGADAFSGEVFKMVWQDSDYAPKTRVISPRRNNLMGYTLGDVKNTGEMSAMAYDRSDHLRMLDTSGQEIWKGSEKYGGTILYYLLPKVERGTENRQYLPMRVLIHDIDGDGKNEVITVRNYDMAFNLLKSLRKLTETEIVSLFWNGTGIEVNWKTPKISGHISDFAIGDFDNDGTEELTAVLILKDGNIIGTEARSAVIAYNLSEK